MEKRIGYLAELGKRLSTSAEAEDKVYRAEGRNPWFVPQFVRLALQAVITDMLDADKLQTWLANYTLKEVNKNVGLIFAGNVPLVGFHDFLCCYVAGCTIQVKQSSKDDELFPLLLKLLGEIDPDLNSRVTLVDTLKGYDAVIATGSDNTNRYFEYYFKNHPRILRKNRNSVAILTGNETDAELEALADDIFLYFGFGCRNVSKLYVPVDFDLTRLFPRFEVKYTWLHNHNKYRNNYDYNRTVLLLNKTPHLANEFIMVLENAAIPSSIATLHYSTWHDEEVLKSHLRQQAEQIQCISAAEPDKWGLPNVVAMGQTQHPGLADYADGVDTLAFLLGL